MTRFMLSLFTLLLISYSAQAWIRVGNGGEGVRVDGTVYVRDLYEQGSYLQPWFGPGVRDSLRERLRKAVNLRLFTPQSELLLRKLSDLENLQTGLGFAVLDTLNAYHFSFDSGTLYLPPNDRDNIREEQRVPLAIRRHINIALGFSAWQKLSSESKVALLIHEAFYALSRPVCTEVDNCNQISLNIRPIVGDLFLPYPPTDLRQRIFSILNISELAEFCAANPLSIHYQIIARARTTEKIVADSTFHYHHPFAVQADATFFCQMGHHLSQQGLFLKVTHDEPTLQVKPFVYFAKEVGMRSQYAIRLTFQKAEWEDSFSLNSIVNCEYAMARMATQNKAPLLSALNIDRGLLCP